MSAGGLNPAALALLLLAAPQLQVKKHCRAEQVHRKPPCPCSPPGTPAVLRGALPPSGPELLLSSTRYAHHHGRPPAPWPVLASAALLTSPLHFQRVPGTTGDFGPFLPSCGASARHRKEQPACKAKQAGTRRLPEAESRDPCRVIQRKHLQCCTSGRINITPQFFFSRYWCDSCPPLRVEHMSARGLGRHHLQWIIGPTSSMRPTKRGMEHG